MVSRFTKLQLSIFTSLTKQGIGSFCEPGLTHHYQAAQCAIRQGRCYFLPSPSITERSSTKFYLNLLMRLYFSLRDSRLLNQLMSIWLDSISVRKLLRTRCASETLHTPS